MMDVAAWRRVKRADLYAARMAMTVEQRHEAARGLLTGWRIIAVVISRH